ncbi:MAG TPA: hypothetical protein DHV85_05035 [Candidatus Accumulibacter sp.]|nr:hypothetical protein [Accumulibacter sp.]HRF10752.1 CzcE family metal-binding protein [Candidatus Accumulibacter phosphatis]
MKNKLAKFSLIAALSVTAATTAFAHQDYSETQIEHWLTHVQESKGQPTSNQMAAYGYASPGVAARTLQVDNGTQALNVARMETVRIDANGKSVTWTFDTLGSRPFPLSKILPGTQDVTVYVNEGAAYSGG